MSVKTISFCLFFLIGVAALTAAPRRYGYEDDQATALREMRDTIEYLRHELTNHESELRMYEERISNQESTLTSMKETLLESSQANKELIKGNAANWESKLSAVEGTNKGLIADLSQLKNQGNESAKALSLLDKRINELEKNILLQNKNIENLQAALRSIAEAIQVKEGLADSDDAKVYRIKAGDNLEKIAKANNTTVKALKERNQLTNDRIIVGQKIYLP